MPHEPYASFFTTSKNKVDSLLKQLDETWRKKEKI